VPVSAAGLPAVSAGLQFGRPTPIMCCVFQEVSTPVPFPLALARICREGPDFNVRQPTLSVRAAQQRRHPIGRTPRSQSLPAERPPPALEHIAAITALMLFPQYVSELRNGVGVLRSAQTER